jgi:nitrogen fixation-related uncharacterized protein
MEALVMFLAVIIGLLALDLAALRWGVDSRGMLPDDHHR